MHFIVIILYDCSLFVKLCDNILVSLIISDIIICLYFILHSHVTFLESFSYSFNMQLFSHTEKLLLLYSSCLSFNNISVPPFVVYGLHSSV